jgi:DNA-binding MurR/RpiR family transcriptional regulator
MGQSTSWTQLYGRAKRGVNIHYGIDSYVSTCNKSFMTPGSVQHAMGDRLAGIAKEITPAEQKVARALTTSAMLAGFETVAALAKRAGVSGPTVVRFVTRLGYASYADFQRALLNEMEARGTSPLTLYHRVDTKPGALLEQSATAFTDGLAQTFRRLSIADFEYAVTALAERRNQVFITGGRFSRLLAEMFYLHLFQIRPNVSTLVPGLQTRSDQLLNVKSKSVLVAYDFRRYEAETVDLVVHAKARGAMVILITDPWSSPAARHADAVLAAEVVSPSPFDSLVPACALTEALIAEITIRAGEKGRLRIEELESLREGYEWQSVQSPGKRRSRNAKPKAAMAK